MSEIGDWLRRAADKIEPEGAWTQEACARTRKGTTTSAYNKRWAACWCMSGAMMATDPDGYLDWPHANSFVEEACGEHGPTYNDAPGRTQAECVAALRKAAELADRA